MQYCLGEIRSRHAERICNQPGHAVLCVGYHLDTCMRPHALSYTNPKLQSASLDHAMWFYHEFEATDWLLYVQDSPASAGGRGMNFGHFFTRDGKLIATAAQEGLYQGL